MEMPASPPQIESCMLLQSGLWKDVDPGKVERCREDRDKVDQEICQERNQALRGWNDEDQQTFKYVAADDG
jgi:hypothetical protein